HDEKRQPLWMPDSAIGLHEDEEPVVTIELPAPRRVTIHVVDEHARPLAGVSLGEQLSSVRVTSGGFGLVTGAPTVAHRLLGETDASGTLVCDVIRPPEVFLDLLAIKDGFRETKRMDKGSAAVGRGASNDDLLAMQLHPSTSHVLLQGGTPMRNHGLAVCAWVPDDHDGVETRVTRVTADSEGAFKWPFPPECDGMFAVLDPIDEGGESTSVALRLSDL